MILRALTDIRALPQRAPEPPMLLLLATVLTAIKFLQRVRLRNRHLQDSATAVLPPWQPLSVAHHGCSCR
jgi:hypothetical protein